MIKNIVLCCLVVGLYACSSTKKFKRTETNNTKAIDKLVVTMVEPPALIYSDSIVTPSRRYTTPNYSIRKPNFVIIHHTAQNSCDATLRAFADSAREVSSHYLICKDGTVHHLLNDYLRAWHAGNSKWGNLTDINSASIGIELDNTGFEPFADNQMTSLIAILQNLKDSFNIPVANFIGHADIAPSRKNDPSKFFSWKTLADKGFGIWYGDTSKITLPSNFDPIIALRIVGYDVSKPAGAYQAFRIHFLQTQETAPLREGEKKILYSLMLKSL
jgi:N-acetylmuramoyl-L-alanine amidase